MRLQEENDTHFRHDDDHMLEASYELPTFCKCGLHQSTTGRGDASPETDFTDESMAEVIGGEHLTS